jgi:spore cortex formation protein SpoVR/YcgB (stage V sporulation)
VTEPTLLYDGTDWDFRTLQRSYDAIERIGCEELGLEVYPNRIEVITSEQMLDVYTAHGMPLTTGPTASGSCSMRTATGAAIPASPTRW